MTVSNKIYRAQRGSHRMAHVSVEVKPTPGTQPLEHYMRHSPRRIYGGSGPADLARSLLIDATGEDPAPAMYHAFKFDVISKIRGDSWEITSTEILNWVENYRAKETEDRKDDE